MRVFDRAHFFFFGTTNPNRAAFSSHVHRHAGAFFSRACASHRAGCTIASGGTVVLATEQDSVGGGFDATQTLKSAMAEVRVWSDVRTPAEIDDFYDVGIDDDDVATYEPELVSLWLESLMLVSLWTVVSLVFFSNVRGSVS